MMQSKLAVQSPCLVGTPSSSSWNLPPGAQSGARKQGTLNVPFTSRATRGFWASVKLVTLVTSKAGEVPWTTRSASFVSPSSAKASRRMLNTRWAMFQTLATVKSQAR